MCRKMLQKKNFFYFVFRPFGGEKKGGEPWEQQVSIMITLASRWAKASRITVTFFAMILNPPREREWPSLERKEREKKRGGEKGIASCYTQSLFCNGPRKASTDPHIVLRR